MMSRILGLIAILLFLSAPALSGPFVGVATVVDGDTIEIQGQRIRLHGIDAPESRQMCRDADGYEYRCGQRSALALDDFLRSARPASCIQTEIDRYRRIIARCSAGGKDVAEWMVENGHALDWPRYSNGEYASLENRARVARLGMWQGRFALPWEWRRDRNAPLVGS